MKLTSSARVRQTFRRDGLVGLNVCAARDVLKGSGTVGQEMELDPFGERVTCQLEWRRSTDRTSFQEKGARAKVVQRYAGGVVDRLSPELTLNVRGSFTNTSETFSGFGVRSAVVRMDGSAFYSITSNVETALAGAIASERCDGSQGENKLIEVTPSVSCGVFGKGRANVRIKWARIFPEGEDSLWDSSLGYVSHRNLEYQADVHTSVSSHTSFSFSLMGRKQGEGKLVSRIRTELRAFF